MFGAHGSVTADEGIRATGEAPVSGTSLAPYLPRLTIDWARSTPEDRYRVGEGTVAFVDISGFTKLSESLARHGKVGAEELTATIGECFVALLDLAVGAGATLLKFGGDALLLYFSGDAHEARACRAAIDMRRELRTVGRLTVLGHKVSLRMSVGVHSGLFNFFLVGDSHRELTRSQCDRLHGRSRRCWRDRHQHGNIASAAGRTGGRGKRAGPSTSAGADRA